MLEYAAWLEANAVMVWSGSLGLLVGMVLISSTFLVKLCHLKWWKPDRYEALGKAWTGAK